MPRSRRRFTGRAGPKRFTSWIDGVNDGTSTVHLALARPESVLFLPLADNEQATVTRIVGSVFIQVQLNQGVDTVIRVAWGIYLAASGSAGDFQLDPLSSLDKDSEHWLHTRTFYQSTNIASATNMAFAEQSVDIKVMRKVNEGDGIKLVFNSGGPFVKAASLRLLIKHT